MPEYAFDTLTGGTLGSYRLERLLGYSQKGPVFLARAGSGSTTYLLRFLAEPADQGAAGHNDYLKRFRYLASQIVALQHPDILPLLDYGTYQGMPYLVLPNLALRSLHSCLDNNGPMNAFTVDRYLNKIAAALEYAHRHGVFHGNLTLASIFLRLDGRLVVADLGLRGLLELNASGKMLPRGSEACAPEQLLGRPTGPYTDVYALGAVLYQLLTGSPVFAGITADEVTQQHLLAAIPPLSQRRSDLPAGLDSVIARALAKHPQERYQQPGALANDYHLVVDPYDPNHVPFASISSPTPQVQQPFVPGLQHQLPQTPLPPTLEDFSDNPTFKRVPALLKQTPLPPTLEEFSDSPTLKRVPALLEQTALPPTLEDFVRVDSLEQQRVPALLKLTPLPPTLEDLAGADSLEQPGNRRTALLSRMQRKSTLRTAVIGLLLLLIASSTVGMVLISRQSAAWAGLTGQVTFFDGPKILLGLCIVLAIAFTVGFNIISRVSLATTRHEYAYTILWQLFCALLAPLFLPFDRFSISVSPQVLLLLALSVALWALVDAFLFSAFKHEEASVLSAIFPLNFVFTFVVSVVFFHSVIKPTIVVGFLIIVGASLLIGLYHTRFRPSKGMVFALLYSFFLGVALGFNSEVVKSFSIPPYMFAAYLFPAAANFFIFLRPKVAELRYELRVQWKKILLNAAVMDVSFFFLLKAFQLGNVPQVVALSASSTLLTALAGIVFLKEDKHTSLKIIAAVLATAGVVLVTLSAST